MIKKHNSTARYNIVAPIGAFANHIRWLLLLDSSFSIESIVDKKTYELYQGTDWPSYQQYLLNDHDNLNEDIKNELTKFKLTKINFNQFGSKLNSFREHIYPSSRTWHNWLKFEWRWRVQLNSQIEICHGYNELIDTHKKTVVCTIDPAIAYKSYVKFNSNCNNTDKNDFLSTIQQANEFHSTLANNSIIVVDSGILFNETLDREWYLRLINWFELEDHYNIAQRVHRLWYDGHKRAESDIVIALTNLYKNH